MSLPRNTEFESKSSLAKHNLSFKREDNTICHIQNSLYALMNSNNEISIFDLNTNKITQKLTGKFEAMAATPDGELMAISSSGIFLWKDFTTQSRDTLLASWPLAPWPQNPTFKYYQYPYSLVIASNGTYYAGNVSGDIFAGNIKEKEQPRFFFRGGTRLQFPKLMLNETEELVCLSMINEKNTSLRLWNKDQTVDVQQSFSHVFHTKILPGNCLAMLGHRGNEITIFDLSQSKIKTAIKTKQQPYTLAITPHNQLVSVDEQGKFNFYDLENFQLLYSTSLPVTQPYFLTYDHTSSKILCATYSSFAVLDCPFTSQLQNTLMDFFEKSGPLTRLTMSFFQHDKSSAASIGTREEKKEDSEKVRTIWHGN